MKPDLVGYVGMVIKHLSSGDVFRLEALCDCGEMPLHWLMMGISEEADEGVVYDNSIEAYYEVCLPAEEEAGQTLIDGYFS